MHESACGPGVGRAWTGQRPPVPAHVGRAWAGRGLGVDWAARLGCRCSVPNAGAAHRPGRALAAAAGWPLFGCCARESVGESKGGGALPPPPLGMSEPAGLPRPAEPPQEGPAPATGGPRALPAGCQPAGGGASKQLICVLALLYGAHAGARTGCPAFLAAAAFARVLASWPGMLQGVLRAGAGGRGWFEHADGRVAGGRGRWLAGGAPAAGTARAAGMPGDPAGLL
jgi:hypothetical protein